MRTSLLIILFSITAMLTAQNSSKLTIDMIMEGPKFVGSTPTVSHWSPDSKTLYFNWNKDSEGIDSLYSYDLKSKAISAVKDGGASRVTFNKKRSSYIYTSNGDLFITSVKKGVTKQITNSIAYESSARFSPDQQKVYYTVDSNLFSWNIELGTTTQLTNFTHEKQHKGPKANAQDSWLKKDQLSMMQIVSERKEARESVSAYKKENEVARPLAISTGRDRVSNVGISADETKIVFSRFKRGAGESTIVPNYVTESSYTENINARTNVGAEYGTSELFVYDVTSKSVKPISLDNLEGLYDNPAYFAEYEDRSEKSETVRNLSVYSTAWSNDGSKVVAIIRANDNKDLWIASINLEDGTVKQLDRQHDDAWIAGPGIGRVIGWLNDNQTIYFQSEATGYSHLYSLNTVTGAKAQLTDGEFEIYSPKLSNDGSRFFFTSNEDNSGIRNFYSIEIDGSNKTKLTDKVGNSEVVLSPNEKEIAVLYSNSNTPTELFVGKPAGEVTQITKSTTEQFDNYSWRKPTIVKVPAQDGEYATARLYKPENPTNKAVIFVHGAGYLQNAHQWWSSYFREYMFHNILVDNGYTVLDIDYRGSAGYGRDWRTGIYRHMGGKDLSDNVDGAAYLVKEHNIAPESIGIYGGSYGGFMTLMALFNSDSFAAGAALRSVTDWAHYNHGYTSNILNTPVLDPIAYKRSSPIYFAEGLNEDLLICHGMIDDNVHFQDVVRLSQRLIELRKENWEMAIFPMEKHGFVEPTSWADEYRRIFKLFNSKL